MLYQSFSKFLFSELYKCNTYIYIIINIVCNECTAIGVIKNNTWIVFKKNYLIKNCEALLVIWWAQHAYQKITVCTLADRVFFMDIQFLSLIWPLFHSWQKIIQSKSQYIYNIWFLILSFWPTVSYRSCDIILVKISNLLYIVVLKSGLGKSNLKLSRCSCLLKILTVYKESIDYYVFILYSNYRLNLVKMYYFSLLNTC